MKEKKFTLVISLLLSVSVYSQNNDFSHLPKNAQKIVQKQFESIKDYKNTKLSYTTTDKKNGFSGFRKIVDIFEYEEDIETVWNVYANRYPQDTFQGPIVNFAYLYDSQTDRIFTTSDHDIPQIEVGHKIFSYLNFLGAKITIALEVVEINPILKKIELAYLEGNASSGTQILEFKTTDQKTVVTHTSYYKSGKKFRDSVIYPYFHKITTKEFHNLIKKELEQF